MPRRDTNRPAVSVDDSHNASYVPETPTDWPDPEPQSDGEALDDLADGKVNRPASSTDHVLMRWHGTDGKHAQDSVIVVSDGGGTINVNSTAAILLVTIDSAGGAGEFAWHGATDRFIFYDDILLTLTEKLTFHDSDIFIHARGDGIMAIDADTTTEIGHGGNIELGDGDLHDMTPQTASKMNCGTEALPFNEGWFSAGVRTKIVTDDVANPPTDAQLDTAFGTPANVGAGFIGVVDDNGAGANVYLCASDGTNWWQSAMTKAV